MATNKKQRFTQIMDYINALRVDPVSAKLKKKAYPQDREFQRWMRGAEVLFENRDEIIRRLDELEGQGGEKKG